MRSVATFSARLSAAVVLGAAYLMAGHVWAQRSGDVLALVGGRLIPSPDVAVPIEDGIVVVVDGRVAAIGPSGSLTIPAGVDGQRWARVARHSRLAQESRRKAIAAAGSPRGWERI